MNDCYMSTNFMILLTTYELAYISNNVNKQFFDDEITTFLQPTMIIFFLCYSVYRKETFFFRKLPTIVTLIKYLNVAPARVIPSSFSTN